MKKNLWRNRSLVCSRAVVGIALFLTLVGRSPGATPEAEQLLDEQLTETGSPTIKSTVRVLRRLNKFFLIDHEENLKPPTPTAAQIKAGYLWFSRNYLEEVYYNSVPRPFEIGAELKLFATPGEYEPATFAVLPLADLTGATVTISNLRGSGGAVIPGSSIEIRMTRQLARGVEPFTYMIGPEALTLLDKGVDIPKNRTTQFWLTLHVPDAQAAGEYRGTVTFKPANHPSAEIPIQVVVLPFQLQEDPGTAFGWWYTGDTPATRERELKDLRAHGCNTFTLPEPKIRSLSATHADIDFSVWEEYRTLCTKTGMTGIKQSGVNFITQYLQSHGIQELGAGFDVPFVTAMRARQQWLDERPDFQVVTCIYDEPRESMLNPWNRTFDQTMAYIRLCRQVPGLRLTVNPISDKDGKKDYTQFGKAVDILNTHAWEGSKKLMAQTLESGRPLWIYNNGQSRLAWGFGVWRTGAVGEWQWTYPSGSGGADAFSPIPLRGYENEGSSATGHQPVYPFPDRIVPAPSFEWCREGVDDYKYLYTLRETLKKGTCPTATAEAEKLFQEMRKIVPEYPAMGLKTGAEAGSSGDSTHLLAYFDHFRWRIALLILQAQDEIAKRPPADSQWAHFKVYPFGSLSAPVASRNTAAPVATHTPLSVATTTLPAGAKVIFDFETDACLQQIETDSFNEKDPFDPTIMPARCVPETATHGKKALFYEPIVKGGSLHLIRFDGNWTGFSVLRIDFINPLDHPINGYLCITDGKTQQPENNPGGRAMGMYDDRYDASSFVVPPGKYTYELPLTGLSVNGGERQLDLSNIRKIAIGCTTGSEKVPYYLDCIRVEK